MEFYRLTGGKVQVIVILHQDSCGNQILTDSLLTTLMLLSQRAHEEIIDYNSQYYQTRS